VEEHKQASRSGKNIPELLHHQQAFPRLTALPACLPPPVHADPMEPAQGCVRLHALALGAGVPFGAPAGHTCLIVGLWGDHVVALSQVPSQSKDTDRAFHFLGYFQGDIQLKTKPIPTQGKPQGTTTNCSDRQYAHTAQLRMSFTSHSLNALKGSNLMLD